MLMLKKRFKLLRNQKGLTLVELLAVIVILGVIAAIAVPAIGGVITNSKTNADIQSEDLLRDAAVRYMMDSDPDGDGKKGASAVTGYASGKVTVSTLVSANYLKSAPVKQETNKTYTEVPVSFASGSWSSSGALTVTE
jgi:type IV pilus assembly protein PilA